MKSQTGNAWPLLTARTSEAASLPEILSGLTIRDADNKDCERVLNLIARILAEFGLPIDPETTDSDLRDIESSYLKRGGAFLVIENDERKLLGTVGLYSVDGPTCQLRKMYLVPGLRGSGLGHYLLQHVVNLAREMGFRRMTLETSSRLEAANHLYTRFGFQPIPLEHASTRADQAYALNL